MKHAVLGLLCLFGLAVGGYFTVSNLYHGPIRPLEYTQKGSNDKALLSVHMDPAGIRDLYPPGKSGIVFGRTSFSQSHYLLEKVINIREVRSSPNVFQGWVVKSVDDHTEIALVYWNKSMWWKSDWWHLKGDDAIFGDMLRYTEDKGKNLLTGESVFIQGDKDSLEDAEFIFGKHAFDEVFPGREKVSNILNTSTSLDKLQRGWVVKDSEEDTEIARIYWNDTFYWRSDWRALGGTEYVENGIFYAPTNQGWDGAIGSNRGVVIGIMFGELFFFLFVFGYLELMYSENWNK